jgi:hypothetical protein
MSLLSWPSGRVELALRAVRCAVRANSSSPEGQFNEVGTGPWSELWKVAG